VRTSVILVVIGHNSQPAPHALRRRGNRKKGKLGGTSRGGTITRMGHRKLEGCPERGREEKGEGKSKTFTPGGREGKRCCRFST